MPLESEMSGEAELIEVSGRPGTFVVLVPLGDGRGSLAYVERTVGGKTEVSAPVWVPEAVAPE